MDNRDIFPACYWLVLSRKIFSPSVPQHPYCILVTMCIMEKCYRYRPPHSFCIVWVVSTHLYSCLQTPPLPFLPILLCFPSFLVSVSVQINSVQENDSYGIPWIFSIEWLDYSKIITWKEDIQWNITKFYVNFSPSFTEPGVSQILPFGPGWKLKISNICSRCLDLWQPMWQFQMHPSGCTVLLYSTWEGTPLCLRHAKSIVCGLIAFKCARNLLLSYCMLAALWSNS